MADETQPDLTATDRRQPWVVALSMLLLALLAMGLYARALDFAYFNDDPTGHFAWMEGRTVVDFFRSSADYGYYRPVVFTALRLTETVAGGHDPVVDHVLLLLLHGANAAMVWLLAYRLSGRAVAYAWVAALAFVVFPFNYEAVAYVASLTHPLLLFWLLLTLHLYIRGRTAGRRLPRLLAGLTLVLGLLTHENGLLAVPALAGVEWVLFRPGSWRAWLRPWWPYALPALLYGPLWLLIPKNSEATGVALAAAGRNGVPFLQSLIYPLLPPLRPDSGETGLLALGALLFLSATAALAWVAGARRLWLFAAGWVVLSALPALLFLSPDYLYGSPRLSYVPSVGVGLLWGVPVLWLWRGPVARLGPAWDAGRALLTVGLGLAIVLPPLSFVRCQLDFYDEASRIVREMAAIGAETPPDTPLTLVNVPYFFSSYDGRPDGCPSPYSWTPVGAVVVPPYAQVRDFVRFNGGPDRAVTAVQSAEFAPGWRTVGEGVAAAGLRSLTSDGRVWVFDLLRGGFADLNAHWEPGAAGAASALAAFGDVLTLTEAGLEGDGGRVVVPLTWTVIGPPPGPLTVFVHFYGPDGGLLAQADAPPGGGLVPVGLWTPGDVIRDSAVLEVNVADLRVGSYRISVGLYDPITGERLPATVNGRPVPGGAVEIGRIDKE